MNRVAKEFVASRADERGDADSQHLCRRLSCLLDALLINPYDVQQLAGAIHQALDMTEEEQSVRMQRLRSGVRENNVYCWAANLLSDLTEIRVDTPGRVEAR